MLWISFCPSVQRSHILHPGVDRKECTESLLQPVLLYRSEAPTPPCTVAVTYRTHEIFYPKPILSPKTHGRILFFLICCLKGH